MGVQSRRAMPPAEVRTLLDAHDNYPIKIHSPSFVLGNNQAKRPPPGYRVAQLNGGGLEDALYNHGEVHVQERMDLGAYLRGGDNSKTMRNRLRVSIHFFYLDKTARVSRKPRLIFWNFPLPHRRGLTRQPSRVAHNLCGRSFCSLLVFCLF